MGLVGVRKGGARARSQERERGGLSHPINTSPGLIRTAVLLHHIHGFRVLTLIPTSILPLIKSSHPLRSPPGLGPPNFPPTGPW